jgi:hypothetical protein
MPIGKKTGGRVAGTPNKTTIEAREAIGLFVNRNAHRLTEWLDAVAVGVTVEDPDTGELKYVVAPNPAKAFDMFQSVIEYHVPKLARQEVVGDPNNPVKVEVQVESDNFLATILKNAELKKQVNANE